MYLYMYMYIHVLRIVHTRPGQQMSSFIILQFLPVCKLNFYKKKKKKTPFFSLMGRKTKVVRWIHN